MRPMQSDQAQALEKAPWLVSCSISATLEFLILCLDFCFETKYDWKMEHAHEQRKCTLCPFSMRPHLHRMLMLPHERGIQVDP